MQYFDNLVNTPQNYAEVMASESRRDGIIKDEAVLLAHNGFNDFYNKLSKTISERIQKKDKVLESAVQATEETTRVDTINEQVQNIRAMQQEKSVEMQK